MNQNKVIKISFISLLTLALLIGLGFYFHIHSVTLEEAVVESKEHEEDAYYILVDEKRIQLKDEKTWNLVKENETYHIEYEYYGLKDPTLTSIEGVEQH